MVESQPDLKTSNTPRFFPHSLINSWELEESQGAHGGFPAYLLLPSSSTSALDTHPLLSDISSPKEEPSLPSLLFLTHRHLWVLKLDFRELAERGRSDADLNHSSSCKLVRVPLGSVVLHPREGPSQVGDTTRDASCPNPKHHHRYKGCDWLNGGSNCSHSILVVFIFLPNIPSRQGSYSYFSSLYHLELIASLQETFQSRILHIFIMLLSRFNLTVVKCVACVKVIYAL